MYAQNSIDYFPARTGSTWRYQQFTLDTAQKQISASKVIITDSLIGTRQYKGKEGYTLVSEGSALRDTTALFIQGDSVSFYNGGFPRRGISLVADSLGIKFLPQAPGWYTYMKLKNPPRDNTTDTLFRRDSTIYVDQVEFPLTLTIIRTRRPAGLVTVPAGNFSTAVPFEIGLNVDTWTFTPLGWWAVPLLRIIDTVFIAKNNWIVKEVQGSTYFPLTNINNDSIPKFRIPGFIRVLEKLTLTSVPRTEFAPEEFAVSQNYPNPFNGITNYELHMAKIGDVRIDLFDALGRMMEVVQRGTLDCGSYTFQWNSANYPSGIYFLRANVNGSIKTKKIILQK